MTVQDCVKEFEFYTVDELVYLERDVLKYVKKKNESVS